MFVRRNGRGYVNRWLRRMSVALAGAELCECPQDQTEWDVGEFGGYVHAGCGKPVIPKPTLDAPYLCGECSLPTPRIVHAGRCPACHEAGKEPF